MLNVFWKPKNIINKTFRKYLTFPKCFTFSIILLYGCGSATNRTHELTAQKEYRFLESDEPWNLISTEPFEVPAFLANRWLGIRLASNGFGIDEKGKALPSFYLKNDVLCKIPNVAQFVLWADGELLAPSKAESYRSVLDMRTGLFTVVWKQKLDDKREIETKIESILHPLQPEFAQRITLTADAPVLIRIWNGWEEAGKPRERRGNGKENFREKKMKLVPVSEGEREMLSQEFLYAVDSILLAPQGGFLVEKKAGGVLFSSEHRELRFTIENVTKLNESGFIQKSSTFEDVYLQSKKWWKERWKTDIEIEGAPEDQKTVRTFLFYLYMNANKKLPPMGLSSEKYRGHRFWDAEAWMLPVYSWIFPEIAKEATRWRLSAIRKSHGVPWEQGAGGVDLTPPEFKNALHVAGWVWWWMERAKAFNYLSEKESFTVRSLIGEQFLRHAKHSPSKTEILSIRAPDEGQERNNDLITNLLAKGVWQELSTDERTPQKKRQLYKNYSTNIKIPMHSHGIPATYDNDHLRGYQQTSALLALFPLEWNFSSKTQNRMFDIYKNRIVPFGPAMSDSVHATIAARLKRPEEAYAFWRASWEPFLRPPNALFSERRNTDETYFLTGAAGCLQVVIYGFLGLRLEKGKVEPNVPSKRMANGYKVSVLPSLPKSWRSITFHNVPIREGYVTIRVTHEGVEINEMERK